MTSPTREEIQTAYEALETLTNTCIHSGDLAEELQELVLRALPPKPRPTMADVEWDADKHRFAEAEHVDDGKVIMIGYEEAGLVQYFRLDGADRAWFSDPEHLTPTGKRYTLTEVQE